MSAPRVVQSDAEHEHARLPLRGSDGLQGRAQPTALAMQGSPRSSAFQMTPWSIGLKGSEHGADREVVARGRSGRGKGIGLRLECGISPRDPIGVLAEMLLL